MKSILLLIMIVGFVAVIGYSAIAQPELKKSPKRAPLHPVRVPGSIWTYEADTKDVITEETPLEEGKTSIAKYKLNTHTTSRIYFKDQGKDKLWNILFVTMDDTKELVSYDENGKDVTAAKKAYTEMVGGPRGTLAKTGVAGIMTTQASDNLTEKEWDEAVLSHLRSIPPIGMQGGLTWSNKVVVEGKEVGEYKIRCSVMSLGGPPNWVTSATLKATHPTTGRIVDVFRYNSTWVRDKNVPSYENYQYSIYGKRGDTKYTIVRKSESRAVNEDTTTPLPVRLLSGDELTKMNAQYTACVKGLKALKAVTPISVDAINKGLTGTDKNLATACKSFFDSYLQWPDGPFAEDILTLADNYNLVSRSGILAADVGKHAPAFKAPMEQKYWYNSKPIHHTDLQGKVVIIEIFGPDCPPCRRNIPHLNALNDKFGKKGLMIIALTSYNYAAVNKKKPYTIEDMVNGFTDSDGTKIQGANYPIVGDTYTFNIFDEDGDPMWSEARKAQAALPQAGLNFRPKGGIPHSFIIDKKGMVVWRGHPAEIGHPKGRVTEENIERLLKGEDMLKIDLPKKK